MNRASRVTGGGISLPEVQDYRRSFPGVRCLVFDGCALPFRDKSFDLVYSNAVIEHLPDGNAQKQFANEVKRVGRGWFVTAPNFWYPVEPHYHLPLIQLHPEGWQCSLVTRLGKTPYMNLHLLNKRQLWRLFPESDVIGWRVTFMLKRLLRTERRDVPTGALQFSPALLLDPPERSRGQLSAMRLRGR